MNWKDRIYAGTLRQANIGQNVTLFGWVDTIRDHGQLLFMHIRDLSGVVQLVFDPVSNATLHAQASSLRPEYCLSITGKVVEREGTAKNTQLPTGAIEIHVSSLTVFSKSLTPPFMISEKTQIDSHSENFNVDEDLRLKYRYLDLRRPSLQNNIIKRHKILQAIRFHLNEAGFIDVETPMLTKSTPEGARDYLVPSRHHENTFYALPQSPQMFKQLLMVSGLDKYYQIVKCFRDEDLRPNRQPEFTQLDLEASFINEAYIYQLLEPLVQKAFAVAGKHIELGFPYMPYDEAMERYGNDHPDIRFDMTLVNLTSILDGVNFKVFQSIIDAGGSIKAINVKGKAEEMSKNMLQEEFAKKIVPNLGAKGMAWMKATNGSLDSSITQFFTETQIQSIKTLMNVEDGDVLLFIADNNKALVNDVLGRLRLIVAEKFGFIDKSKICPVWVTEFPMFEEKDGRLHAIHHPFTQPDDGFLSATTIQDYTTLKSRAYDLVINGEEVGGGSIRIHDASVQHKVFEVLGLSEADIKQKFGFFVEALSYGTPPHGGLALGVDRLVSIILDAPSIREVIAFPKNRVAFCPLTQAPSPVDPAQLNELHIAIIEKESNE